jgi:hypothetical protein
MSYNVFVPAKSKPAKSPNPIFDPRPSAPPLLGAVPFRIYPGWLRESGAGGNQRPITDAAPKATSAVATALHKLVTTNPRAFSRLLTANIDERTKGAA